MHNSSRNEILADFSLIPEKHIIACVTDGASVMKKFGYLFDALHQQCYAHGIHLAVCDVLYKKQTPFSTSDSTNEDAREVQSTNDEEDDELSENNEDIK